MRVLRNSSSAPCSSLRAGGVVPLLYLPQTMEECVQILQRHPSIPVLGRGSNTVLSARNPVPALLVTSQLDHISISDETLVAKTGTMLARLATLAVRQGYGGFAPLAGIPGTIGGALVMNAGCYGVHISDRLLWVEIWRDGEIVCLQRHQMEFGYRCSSFDPAREVILRAAFDISLRVDESQQLRQCLERKKASQPTSLPSLGSVFRNPSASVSSWQLLEKCELKGMRLGSMQISEKHANFIVNLERGSAWPDDYVVLARMAANRVYQHTGILLEPEFRYLSKEGYFHGKEIL